VLIIGAGINGTGLFRDLTAQGLTCLLLEQNDYGSGTSAAPSRLIHGGLKYLETGEFRLVAQSTLERNLLLANAPHYVKPLPTTMPIYSLVGGKWTTFRGSEEVADMLLQRLKHPRNVSIRHLAIGGGRDYPDTQTAHHAWIAIVAQESTLQERITQLFEHYGTLARSIAAHIKAMAIDKMAADKPLVDAPDYSHGEIDYLIRYEQVGSLGDLILRRTTLAVTGRLTLRLVETLNHQVADILGWNDARRKEGMSTLTEHLRIFHGVTLQ